METGETLARRNAHELRVQMDELRAEAVDRGLLLTLDDTVFITNSASLSGSDRRRLDTLAGFLKQHPERSVVIDGYAGAGNYRYDQALSKRRADAVKAYLIQGDHRRSVGLGDKFNVTGPAAVQRHDTPNVR